MVSLIFVFDDTVLSKHGHRDTRIGIRIFADLLHGVSNHKGHLLHRRQPDAAILPGSMSFVSIMNSLGLFWEGAEGTFTWSISFRGDSTQAEIV